jgi:hypothetical protein
MARASPGLQDLPADLLIEHLLSRLGLEDVRALRLAAKCLKTLGGGAVNTLLADGGNLPAGAFLAFPSASGVVVSLAPEDLGGAIRRRLQSLAAQLPDSLQRVTIQWLGPEPLQHEPGGVRIASDWRAAATTTISALLQKLPQLPLCQHLEELAIGGAEVTATAAQAALGGLPGLQRAELMVAAQDRRGVTIARFPPALQQLLILLPQRGASIDARGLAACPELRRLTLQLPTHSCLLNPGAISGVTSLELLALWDDEGQAPDVQQAAAALHCQILSAASQLPRLEALEVAHLSIAVGSEQWAQLRAMPGLRHLQLGQLDAAGAEAAGAPAEENYLAAERITCVEAWDIRLADEPSAPGVLAQLLPGLQRLSVRRAQRHLWQLVQALHGHGTLTALELVDAPEVRGCLADEWPAAAPLSSMPQLERLVLVGNSGCGDGDGLLRDAAGCAALEVLVVAPDWTMWNFGAGGGGGGEEGQGAKPGRMTSAGLAALAAGPCSGSLRRLALVHQCRPGWLEGMRQLPAFSPADVALLLGGGALPALEALVLDVRLARGGPGAAGAEAAGGEVGGQSSQDTGEEPDYLAAYGAGYNGVIEVRSASAIVQMLDGEDDDEDEAGGGGEAAGGVLGAVREQVLAQLRTQLEAAGLRGVRGLDAGSGRDRARYTIVKGWAGEDDSCPPRRLVCFVLP